MADTLVQLGWSGDAAPVRVLSGAQVMQAQATSLHLSLTPGVTAVLHCPDPRALQVAALEPQAQAQAAPLPIAVLCPDPETPPRHALMSDGRVRSVTRLLEGATGFLPDTRLATPDGGRPAGRVQPGDRLLTRDNGFQPVLWSGRIRITPEHYGALCPVAPMRIAAHAIGPGQPGTEIALPLRHRVLLADSRAALHFEEREVLVAAQDLPLLGRAHLGAGQAMDLMQVLLPGHQVILAEGLWCETLQPTPERLSLLAPADRRRVLALARDGSTERDGAAARLMLTRAETGLLRVGI